MATRKAEVEPTRTWWPARQCWTYLGVSRQRWQRIVSEQGLEPLRDDRGVHRFDPEKVEDLAEVLGLSNEQDDRTVAINVLRDTIESMGEYVKLVQENERAYAKLLIEENADLRKMRKEEQHAHLEAMIATQEALDQTAERKAALEQTQGTELRKALALEFLFEKVVPRVLQQWQAQGAVSKVAQFVQSMTETELASVSALLDEDQRAALETLRKHGKEEQKEKSDDGQSNPSQ